MKIFETVVTVDVCNTVCWLTDSGMRKLNFSSFYGMVLFEDQICKNNDMKSVMGINIHEKDDTSYIIIYDS